MKEWIVSALDKEKASRIAERWGLPFFLAMLLEIRGITEPKEIESFLSDEACAEGWFTGTMIGICCQDLTGFGKYADFDWFEVRAN